MIDELEKDLHEATARIAENRLLAWSSASNVVKLGKVPLQPLTAKAWIDLKLVDNAIACGGKPTDQDVLEYLWRNSSGYSPDANTASEKAKRKIGFTFAKTEAGELLKLVYRHINDAFVELPQSIKCSNGVSRNNTMPAIEGMIGAIDEVASRYGQNPIDVLTWPLNRIFQLQKAIRLATIPDYKLAEPQLIKAIKQEILTELNNGTESRT